MVQSGQLEIPALPVLVPLGAVLMLGCWVRLRRAGWWRLTAGWAAAWYAVAVLGATMLPLSLSWGDGSGGPELFRVILLPVATMRVDDFLLNIVMTLPLAALLHAVFGIDDRRRVIRIGLLASVTIESAQLLLILLVHGNRWADTNDIVANTLGALLGHVLFRRVVARRYSSPIAAARRSAR